jgi:HSP20 family protein
LSFIVGRTKNPITTTNKEKPMKLIRYTTPEASAWTSFNRISPLSELLDSAWNLSATPGFVPAMEYHEDTDKVTVSLEAAGMKKESFEIALEDGALTIAGSRERNLPEGNSARSELLTGSFQRSVTLPCPVKADAVSATYEAGILTVTLPKAEEAKPRKITVS